ncbi:MAG: hypothetical protein ACQEUD_07290 [Bacillota bacterium]
MDLNCKYEKKILVFFDVLGFKDMVLRKYKDKPEQIKEILNTMHVLSSPSYTSELIIFSDSVINILEIKPNYSEHEQTFADYLNVIFNDIATIQVNMFGLYGVLIRGSIVIGDIYYEGENNLLFGPALVDAYELESKYCIYPRFLIGKSIVDKISEAEWLGVTEDVDGHYYIDVFKWLVKLEPEKQHLLTLKSKIEEEINMLGDKPNLGVLSKYSWFLNKIKDRERQDLRKNRT